MTTLLKQPWLKNTVLFLSGQTISLFGSSIVQYAIMWHITRTTDSGLIVGLSMIVGFLPQVLVGLFGGVLADRFPRKRLILIADIAIAGATLILALIMTSGYFNLAFILLISFIRSVGAGIQSPAVSAIIPQIVPQDKLMRVNGVYGSVSSLISLCAPIVAAFLLANSEFYILLFLDVLTAIIGVSLLLMVQVEMHELTSTELNVREDLMSGIHYVRDSLFLKRLMGYYVIMFLLIIPTTMLNVLLVTRSFSDAYNYLMANEVAFFVGATLGGIVIAAWGGFKNRLTTFNSGLLVFALTSIGLAIAALLGYFPLYLAIMLICGLTMGAFNSPIYVLIQEHVAIDYQGRVFSLLQIVGGGVMPLGTLIYGPLADVVSIEVLMIVSSVLLLVLVYRIWTNPSFMHHGLPAVPLQETHPSSE